MRKLGFIVILISLFAFSSTVFAADAVAKKWTVMVFVNADNNLDRFGVLDMQEMEKAGLSGDINVVTQIDRSSGKPARRYSVTDRAADAKADDWGLTSKKIADIGEVDMGDYKEVVNFVKWAKENYPAEKYLLVLWNHGAGWKNKEVAPVFKGISYDDQSGNHITTPQLGEAIKAIHGVLGQPLDILAFDACLMQMVEVVYEVRESVKFMVGSEETEPGDGWPYDLVLTPLVQNPAMTAEELAKLIPQAYAESYSKKGSGTTQSALDCSKIEKLASVINEFAVALGAAANTTDEAVLIKNSLSKVQKFAYADNIDLGHFVKLVLDGTKDEKVKETGNCLLMMLSKAIIQNKLTGTSTQNATGIAIYFPRYSFNSAYAAIKFAEYGWDDMVKAVNKLQAVAEAPAPTTPSAPSSGGYTGGGYNDYPDVYPFPGGWGHTFPGGFHPMPPMPMY